jgi:L-threonylcarbamoyladenylate synthase
MLILKENDEKALELALEFLRAGKVISFATDTVYGVAADANNLKAIESLYEIKKRDAKNPVAIFVKDLATAEKIFHFEEETRRIIKEFGVDGLTFVLKTKSENLSHLNKNNDGFLGFRIVNKTFLEKLLEKFNKPLAVTSANLSGQKASVEAKEVEKYFAQNKSLALLVDGGICKEKTASTVVKISNKQISILRQGLKKIL